MDVRIRGGAGEDYDFSWVYWFETHGQVYLREAIGQRALPWDTPGSRRWRGDVAGALMGRLDDEDAEVRAAAVLALGRMGREELLDRVLPGVGGGVSLLLDVSEQVRLCAWVSLGLLQTQSSRAALAAEPMEDASELDRVGQAVGIGLLGELDRVHGLWLLSRLEDDSETLEVKRWCVWAMTQHDDASVDARFEAVLAKLPSTFLIGEVLGNYAYVQRRGGAVWLVDVLRYHPDVRDWQGYRALSTLPEQGFAGSTPRRLAMETRVAAVLSMADQPLLADEEDRRFVLSQLQRRMVAGNSAEAMDFHRGFETLAYFMHCEADAAAFALLYDQMRGLTSLRPDDPAVVEKTGGQRLPTEQDLIVRQPGNGVRDYAALAAGLLIRRATEGTQLCQARPLIAQRAIEMERLKRRFGIRLMRGVADDREPMSYRAACAIAIGLTGDDRYRAALSIELSKLKAGDEAVLGYGLLALALLGEDRVVDPATRYLTRPGVVQGIGDLLGRRAAMQALAVAGAGPGIDEALTRVWGRNAWISEQVGEVMAWTGQYASVPNMLQSLASESPKWRAAAAASLGAAFDTAWPSQLSILTERSNPTISLRPEPSTDTNRIEAEPEPALADPAQSWPMGRVYALHHPFLVAMKQGLFDTQPTDQDAR